MNNELRHGREGEEWSKLGRVDLIGDLAWDLGKQRGRCTLHSTVSEASAWFNLLHHLGTGIHIGIQTTIALHCFGMRKRDSSKCPTNFRMLEINEAQSTGRTNLVWHMPAIPSFDRPSSSSIPSLLLPSHSSAGSLPSIHPPSVLVLFSPHPTQPQFVSERLRGSTFDKEGKPCDCYNRLIDSLLAF